MSYSPSRLFYHPPYWCHSCDMSIGLPPSPTPNALLCPHCHHDSLVQMEDDVGEMEGTLSPPSRDPRDSFPIDHTPATTLTPSDDNFLLTSPYLHRLIHHLTTTSADANPRSTPAPKSSIESLQEVFITSDSDLSALCPVCKDPFVVNSVAKMMPCKHTYHPDCIVPWLEISNSCPVCRSKLPTREEEVVESGSVMIEDLMDDEGDLYFFRNTLRHMARRHRWPDEENIGSGSEGNLFSPSQIAEVNRGDDGFSWRENSVETVSSWPRWPVEDGGGGGGRSDNIDAFPSI